MARLTFPLLTGLLLTLDQVSKAYIRGHFRINEQKQIIPGVLEILHTQNRGIAFGMLQGIGIWLAPLALAVAVFAAVSYYKAERRPIAYSAGLILLAAGALGNFVDRAFMGGVVTDFINIYIIHVFNIADACITIGAFCLIIHWITDRPGEKQSTPTPP